MASWSNNANMFNAVCNSSDNQTFSGAHITSVNFPVLTSTSDFKAQSSRTQNEIETIKTSLKVRLLYATH